MSTSSNPAPGTGPVSGSAPAPENFPAFLEKTTAALDALTTTAAGLPGKSDLAFHRTLDRKFGKELDATAQQVLGLTERLLALVEVGGESSKAGASASGTAGKAKTKTKARRKLQDEEDVVDGYRRGVDEVVDGLLEDADSNLDELNGQKKKAAITVGAAALAAAGKKLPGPFDKTKGRLPSHLHHAHDMTKPQLQFHDSINNAYDSPAWTPTLAHKHHAMVPLEFEAPLDDISDGESSDPSTIAAIRAAEVQRRRHPYWFETQHIPYPTSMFAASPPIEPASFEATPFQFVDRPEQLEQLVEKLKVAKEIAVDLEHHSARSYAGFTCLMQISTREGDWVVDTLKLRKELRADKLGGVFADPAIIKVFHGADSDIVWLQKDFDIYVVNLFDTFHATKVLDFQGHSLASLLSLYCNFTADKRYQMADWRIRPLDPDMLHYARADTHYLLYIYDNLRNALLDKSSRPPSPSAEIEEGQTAESSAEEQPKRRNPQEAMREVLDRSAETALKLYERETYDPLGSGSTGWKALARKWLPKGAVEEMPGMILRRLHAWRDKVAREEDEGPFYVITNMAVKDLSLLRAARPNLVQRILAVRPMLAAQRAGEVVQVIQDAIDEYEAQGSLTHPPPGESTEQSTLVSNGNAAGGPSTPSAKLVESTSERPPAGDVSQFSDDLWGRFAHTATRVSSKLFGQTISSKASPSTSPSVATKALSSLFAKAALSRSAIAGGSAATSENPAKNGKEVSPGFESVLQGIKDDLAPTRNGVTQGAESTTEKGDDAANRKNTLPKSETVPYIPANARSTVQSGASASASDAPGSTSHSDSAPAQQEVKRPKKDDVVQVKRKQGKKRDRAITNGDVVGDVEGKKPRIEGVVPAEASPSVAVPSELSPTGLASTSADSPLAASPLASGSGGSGKISKKGKQKKVRAEDIPVFDYSQEGNLLDNSAAARKVEPDVKGKGKKKDKKPKAPGGIMAIETPKFGKRAAKDMSQPKAGNKSGTFT